jgi:hypothetical protein
MVAAHADIAFISPYFVTDMKAQKVEFKNPSSTV